MDDRFLQLTNYTFSQNSSDEIVDITSPAPEEDFSDANEVVVPKIGPTKTEGKPLIIVIDDDYSTLDLMKIYLQRDYEYVSFDSPKNAIFYLNHHIPALIFIDCYMSVIPAKQVIEIVRSYKELQSVPIVYIADPAEKGAVLSKAPADLLGCITRPVARGELVKILNQVFPKKDEKKTDETITELQNES